jgi:hypothetical protein
MARLQNAGRVSATNVEFDRSGSFAYGRECSFGSEAEFKLRHYSPLEA